MFGPEWRFLLTSLATWRLTHLVTSEDGPADVIVRVRARLGNSMAGRAMDCFYCSSIWFAAPLALFVSRDPVEWTFAWLASSGAACLLERVSDRNSQSPTTRPLDAGASNGMLWRTSSGLAGDVPEPTGSGGGAATTAAHPDTTDVPRR